MDSAAMERLRTVLHDYGIRTRDDEFIYALANADLSVIDTRSANLAAAMDEGREHLARGHGVLFLYDSEFEFTMHVVPCFSIGDTINELVQQQHRRISSLEGELEQMRARLDKDQQTK